MNIKKRNLIAYAVVSTLVVFGGGAAVGLTLHGSEKAKVAAPVTVTASSVSVTPQEAGVELAKVYNATPPQTVQIVQVAKCAENPDKAGEYACAVVATDGKQQACIGITGTVEPGKPAKVEGAQQIDPSYCQ